MTQNDVATPSSIGQVATSIPCRDQPLLLPQNAPVATQNLGHDTKSPQGSQNHVATSNRCHGTVSPAQLQTRLRHQNQVAILLKPNLCHDINFMSRLQFPIGQVATSVPCRDLLETNLCRDLTPAQNGISRSRRRNPCRDLPCCDAPDPTPKVDVERGCHAS